MLKIINLLKNLLTSVDVIEKNEVVNKSATSRVIQISLNHKNLKILKNLQKSEV